MERKINVIWDMCNMNKGWVLSDEVAELAGLWLAEGDDKTRWEITITNNVFDLILFSYKTLNKIFKADNYRIYVYLPKKDYNLEEKLPPVAVKKYVDKRATKPYFILRLADIKKVRVWRTIVNEVCSQEKFYASILRGFFAGEGNIKTGSHKNRTIRIAQKERIEIMDKILNHFWIEWKFSKKGRSYEIVGRKNWEKLAKIKIADLHPDKKKKFWNVYESYKQWHYKKHHIRDNVLNYLSEPKTSLELAEQFDRGQARIQDVLIDLKKEGKIKDFVVRSKHYWLTTESNLVPISNRKKTILDCLASPKRTCEIAKTLKIDGKSALRRLRELDGLGLVSRNDYYWHKIQTNNEVMVCE